MNRSEHERYSRQILVAGIGERGQERILASRAALVGCGALGSVLAGLLVRAGIGRLRIIDRDFVEPSNLQRQTLFDESDARAALPKAVAAERHLRAANSRSRVEGIVEDLSAENAHDLLGGFDLILDGTDNFQTRLLINDAAIDLATTWIYGAAVGSYGVMLVVRPGQTACLACLLESGDCAETISASATCDTAGILSAAASQIASLQAAEALKILAGKWDDLHGRLVSCDVWSGKFQSIRVAKNADCRACGRREFTYLEGEAQPQITMCGRDAVQIHEHGRSFDLEQLSSRLSASAANIRHNDFLLRFSLPPYDLTVFADGRAIVKGTQDPAIARSLYARYLGS